MWSGRANESAGENEASDPELGKGKSTEASWKGGRSKGGGGGELRLREKEKEMKEER